jgi:hypothetical protein
MLKLFIHLFFCTLLECVPTLPLALQQEISGQTVVPSGKGLEPQQGKDTLTVSTMLKTMLKFQEKEN